MKTSEVLAQAKAKIASENHWIQDQMACDGEGNTVEPKDPRATCWCSLGALVATGADLGERMAAKVILRLALRKFSPDGFGAIAGYNDSHDHADVMKMWSEAIKLAKAEEQRAVPQT